MKFIFRAKHSSFLRCSVIAKVKKSFTAFRGREGTKVTTSFPSGQYIISDLT